MGQTLQRMPASQPKRTFLVVFSDLDGSLLDHHTYSYAPARPALEALKERGVPLVLCSSKTRAEMEGLWRDLDLDAPFIAENGAALYAPPGCRLPPDEGWQAAEPGWRVIALGRPVAEVRRSFAGFKDRFLARGFGDMDELEVAVLTGLSPEEAARARRREYNEPVLLPEPEKNAGEFTRLAREAGLEVTQGGRFFHLLGGGDKGRAVHRLCAMYRRRHPDLVTMALGDAPNDRSMLAQVDHPVLLAKGDGSHAEVDLPGLKRQARPGPEGWKEAVLEFLHRYGP